MAEDSTKVTVNAEPKATVNGEPKKSKEKKSKKENSVLKFFRDLKGEFKKIVWPSKKQIINNTIIVIVAIIVIGCFIWALDFGLGALIKLFLA